MVELSTERECRREEEEEGDEAEEEKGFVELVEMKNSW
jgi:hypothetical protein